MTYLQLLEEHQQVLQRRVLVTGRQLTNPLVLLLQGAVRLIGLLEELFIENKEKLHKFEIVFLMFSAFLCEKEKAKDEFRSAQWYLSFLTLPLEAPERAQTEQTHGGSQGLSSSCFAFFCWLE